VRDKVVDLIIGQISLLFACVDQLFYVVVLVIKCQARISSRRPRLADAKLFSGGSRYGVVREAHKLQKYSTPITLAADAVEVRARLPIALSRPYLVSRYILR
jgi:hypothetical protein